MDSRSIRQPRSLGTEPWTRILQLPGDQWVGLGEGKLSVGDFEKPKREIDPDRPTGLLALLERPYSAVLTELRDREELMGVARGAFTRLLPLSAVVAESITIENDYWAALALTWIEEMPAGKVPRDRIAEVEHACWASQAVRHKARRLLRQLDHELGAEPGSGQEH